MLPDSRLHICAHSSSLAAAAIAYANTLAATCRLSPETDPQTRLVQPLEAPVQTLAGCIIGTVPRTLIMPATADTDPAVPGSSMADGMTSGGSQQQQRMGTEAPGVPTQKNFTSQATTASGSPSQPCAAGTDQATKPTTTAEGPEGASSPAAAAASARDTTPAEARAYTAAGDANMHIAMQASAVNPCHAGWRPCHRLHLGTLFRAPVN